METVIEQAKGRKSPSILPVFVGIKLGGIVSFPLGEEATVWVNGSGTGNRGLPSGRGFQKQEFYGYSLLNLWYSHYTLTCSKRPSNEAVAKLASQLQHLESLVKKDVDDHKGALKSVEAAWKRIATELQLFLRPGPRFDCVAPKRSSG